MLRESPQEVGLSSLKSNHGQKLAAVGNWINRFGSVAIMRYCYGGLFSKEKLGSEITQALKEAITILEKNPAKTISSKLFFEYCANCYGSLKGNDCCPAQIEEKIPLLAQRYVECLSSIGWLPNVNNWYFPFSENTQALMILAKYCVGKISDLRIKESIGYDFASGPNSAYGCLATLLEGLNKNDYQKNDPRNGWFGDQILDFLLDCKNTTEQIMYLASSSYCGGKKTRIQKVLRKALDCIASPKDVMNVFDWLSNKWYQECSGLDDDGLASWYENLALKVRKLDFTLSDRAELYGQYYNRLAESKKNGNSSTNHPKEIFENFLLDQVKESCHDQNDCLRALNHIDKESGLAQYLLAKSLDKPLGDPNETA